MATHKQTNFMETLLKDRDVPEARAAATLEKLRAGGYSSAEASRAITELLTMPRKAVSPAYSPTPTVEVPIGMHELNDIIFKVYKTRNGHIVTKELVIWDDKPSFEYRGKAGLKGLSDDTRLSDEAAAKFGRTYGICVRCARHLTDERSIAVGYGATCASNEGWYYPTMDEALEALRSPASSDMTLSPEQITLISC